MKKTKAEILDGVPSGAAALALTLPIVLAIKHAPAVWFQYWVGLLGAQKFLWLAGAITAVAFVPLFVLVRWLILKGLGSKSAD